MNKKFLQDLVMKPSPSGYEKEATEVWEKELSGLPGINKGYSDKIGNSCFYIGQGQTKVLLSGHIDQVNARVSLIHDNGLLAIQYTGGIDNRCLPGSWVSILTDDDGVVSGAVIKQAMHLDESDKWPEDHCDMSQLRIDVGVGSKEEAIELGIHPGSPVCYKPEIEINFGSSKVCGTSLDDKIGVFIVSEIMKNLSKEYADSIKGTYPHWYNKYTIVALAATQEETGLRGAAIAAKALNPNISIDFDVTFCSDDELSEPKEKIGDIELGKGPVISWGCDKSPRLNQIIKKIAKDKDIKFQEESSRSGGTNTDTIQLFSLNCETTHLAIPNRSMHSQTETCDWDDIQGAIDIITETIQKQLL